MAPKSLKSQQRWTVIQNSNATWTGTESLTSLNIGAWTSIVSHQANEVLQVDFHVLGPLTAKLRWAMEVQVRHVGLHGTMTQQWLSAAADADDLQLRQLEYTSQPGNAELDRAVQTLPRQEWTAVLNMPITRSRNGSQWSAERTGIRPVVREFLS